MCVDLDQYDYCAEGRFLNLSRSRLVIDRLTTLVWSPTLSLNHNPLNTIKRLQQRSIGVYPTSKTTPSS